MPTPVYVPAVIEIDGVAMTAVFEPCPFCDGTEYTSSCIECGGTGELGAIVPATEEQIKRAKAHERYTTEMK